MFNPFKKNKINEKAIYQILDECTLYNQPFHHFIQKKNIHDDVLDIDLMIDTDILDVSDNKKALEDLYQAICLKCQNLGIHEVNFNVAVAKKSAAKIHRPDSSKKIPTHTPIDKPTKTAPKQKDIPMHPRITHIIAVASGKGGVGKSTTSVNLALALKKLGARVGILDADIYGPSVPDMLGVAGVKPQVENEQFVPIEVYGLATLSIGNLIDSDNTPIAWRGSKATGALMQLYEQTNWPNLDYLIIDMPPGTGDIQLTLAQRIPITAAIIVTTPQHIALLDVKKGVELFGKTDIAVMGIVENMALHTCSNCGHTEAIFGEGGGDEMSKLYNIPLLGRLPLAAGIGRQIDQGVPSVVAYDGQGDEFAQYYIQIAQNITKNIQPFSKKTDNKRIF
jgi:cobyrinic acid a,c-diamide synthase